MDNNQNNNKNPKNNKQNWSIIIITTLVTALLVLGLYSFMQKTTSKEISYSEFLKMLDDKKIEEVVFVNWSIVSKRRMCDLGRRVRILLVLFC